ncbi:hypothetical protein [Micromonospora sp. NPDC049240]|uniref:hypothetical protein n=1 Tax=Micromonospora sp. NPDC049240 TaxID=3155151 RepID=UPI00340C3F3A
MPRLNGDAAEVFRAVIVIITEDRDGNEVSRLTEYAGPFAAKGHAKAAITSLENWAKDYNRHYGPRHGGGVTKRIEARRERAPLAWERVE